jgi:DNA-3-methyladenine glycosylase II
MYDPPDTERLLALRQDLAARDPAFARAHAAAPVFAWRVREGGYAGLMKMIVGQQVSTASANAIWLRVEAGLGVVEPTAVLALPEEALRAFGLSRPKVRYFREVALACADGRLDFDALRAMSDEDAVTTLTAVKGIGRWTAEIYLMFCEGRLDLFPAADIALQEAMRWTDGGERRPTAKEASARALAWAPYRSVAAHLLWRWYGAVKGREIAPPV